METLENKLKDFLHAQGFETVREIVIERGPDSTGDPALFVWLLLDNGVTDKEMSHEFIESLREAAYRQARVWEPELFPYVRARRVREWQEMVAL